MKIFSQLTCVVICLGLSLLTPVWAADSSGRFIQPKPGSTFTGPLLLSIQTEDLDGLRRVYVSLNDSPQYLDLCQSAEQCQGNSFKTTVPNINPAAFAVNAGPLVLQLWVTDTSGINTAVSSVSVNWQPANLNNLAVQRSADGAQIDVSWAADPAIIRYNLYLASVSGVNRFNYRQLPDGQAKLALRGNSAAFTNLNPLIQYYLLVTGLRNGGELPLSAEIPVPSSQQSNQPPTAAADSYDTAINQTLQVAASEGLLANDTDPDGDLLTVNVTPVSQPQSGTLTLQIDGSFSYTPDPDFMGADNFIYQISDSDGGTSEAEVSIDVIRPISNINGESLTMTGEFLYIGQGEQPPGSEIGTGLYRIGDCIQLVDTRCSMLGRYEETGQSGNVVGQQGNFTFVMRYPGVGNSPVLARSVEPNSNTLQFVSTAGARFELNLFPDDGGKFSSVYPATPFVNSLNFGAFISNTASCSGLTTQSCSIGQVGRVAGAQIEAALDRLTFTIPGSALDTPAPRPPVANDDIYTITVNQPLNIEAPGLLSNDLEGRSLSQGDQLEILHNFNPGLGSLVGLAVNEYQQALYLYPSFAATIHLLNRLGENLSSLAMQGEGANDVDLDIAAEAFTLKDTQIPQGSLLIFNGESGVTEIYAIDPQTGTLLSQLDAAFGNSHVVGGAYNPVTATLWLLQDNVPAGTEGNLVAQIDPTTGQVLSSFNVVNNQHSFSVSFGDLHINPHNGNILLVSSIQSAIAEFDINGNLLRLMPLPVGVSSISGLTINADGSRLWLASTNGSVFELGFTNEGVVPTLKIALLSEPTNGTLLLKPDGSFSYTPNTNFIGQDSFTYQVIGAFGGSSQATVVIDVQ
ncbi:Ig-like domain-containing protein [Rheinheimera maricola]|uniref:Tandem-95 repeat protein n=1 Tax=Rheinheimera maricola TaxID=2793282 RepID=A0ABS7X4N3_9GAMM|nr:Ig-like domain-containing protein [Rheinheimera maricola]MBZ9610504.1 tandem-95 repeat protein [Rheinheimera maricola]